jgi:hypothetical protein
MRRTEELIGQQLAGAAVFMEETDATTIAEQEKTLEAACIIMNAHPQTIFRSRHAEEDVRTVVATITAEQEKTVLEVAEDASLAAKPVCRCRHNRIYGRALSRVVPRLRRPRLSR